MCQRILLNNLAKNFLHCYFSFVFRKYTAVDKDAGFIIGIMVFLFFCAFHYEIPAKWFLIFSVFKTQCLISFLLQISLYFSRGSYGVFPKTQSFAQNSLPPRPHFVPERSGAFSYPPVPSAVPGPLILPPPDFSVPPPFPPHALQGCFSRIFRIGYGFPKFCFHIFILPAILLNKNMSIRQLICTHFLILSVLSRK